jgi:hypothetical protein
MVFTVFGVAPEVFRAESDPKMRFGCITQKLGRGTGRRKSESRSRLPMLHRREKEGIIFIQ